MANFKEEEPPVKKIKTDDDEDVSKRCEWKTLSYDGPVFAPPYETLPNSAKFFYDGKPVKLNDKAEEVAGFYAKLLEHENYVTNETFNKNFFEDWKKTMNSAEQDLITDLKKCDFTRILKYFKKKTKEKRAWRILNNISLVQKYGYCLIDGRKQKIGNFKIEPPGLLKGRGEHPKNGKLKKRIMPEDVIINIGKEADVPEPPKGHKWKEVRHDNKVTWLASWTENILGQNRYIYLHPSSELKGKKDRKKYDLAQKLKEHIDDIREEYIDDWESEDMLIRQRGVALYFVDEFAFRAGNKKDLNKTSDTVGCCSLKVDHIKLHDEMDGKKFVVNFDFLGKDSVRYTNSVPVKKIVYENLKKFMANKEPKDELFDQLNPTILNNYLKDRMDDLTLSVFRTFNASETLQQQLDLLTKEEMRITEKVQAYKRANKNVAVLCNHQISVDILCSVEKRFHKKMEDIKNDIKKKRLQIKAQTKSFKYFDVGLQKHIQILKNELKDLVSKEKDMKNEKEFSLLTTKLNYIDPRITVAWCMKWNVPIEKIYTTCSQRKKFKWAIEKADRDFRF